MFEKGAIGQVDRSLENKKGGRRRERGNGMSCASTAHRKEFSRSGRVIILGRECRRGSPGKDYRRVRKVSSEPWGEGSSLSTSRVKFRRTSGSTTRESIGTSGKEWSQNKKSLANHPGGT